jgi:hypothetical protein
LKTQTDSEYFCGSFNRLKTNRRIAIMSENLHGRSQVFHRLPQEQIVSLLFYPNLEALRNGPDVETGALPLPVGN